MSDNTTGGAPVEQAPAQSATDTSVDASVDQSQETPVEVKATPTEKKRIKQLQLKIDGEEFIEELPFEVDEEHAEYLRKNLQLSKKANKHIQSEKATKSQVEQFVKMLTSDTKNTLQQMGINLKDFAASIIEEELQKEAMTPDQRETAEAKSQLKKLQEEREREKSDFQKRELERLQEQELISIDTKMNAAIEKSGMSNNAHVIRKMATYMLDAANRGVRIEPEDIADMVKEEIQTELRQFVQSLGEDKVETWIGKDVLDKIRKKNISKAKVTTAATAKAGVKDTGAAKTTTPKVSEKLDMKTFFKF